ncbi:MAG: hypothetical protein IPM61_15795 [Chlorobi bacterium]|nr:hypothetical protein [Chlorobiota bacterium]MBX7218042.1 hypothetical protein [Candidatus Kapabacteria bacterium]
MESEVLLWSIAVLAVTPAVLVASGYWESSGTSIAAAIAGGGVSALLALGGSAIAAVAVLALAIAGLQWRRPSQPAEDSKPVSWGNSLIAVLFCGVVGGGLLAVIGSVNKGSSTPLEGTPTDPLRLFDADLLLLWIAAAVSVAVWRVAIPAGAHQNSISVAQSSIHPTSHHTAQ